ncbi:MarR family winged helix-turn-helix transcriptional regulator [Streptomyces sp. NPDC101160]|uniref:MarR family winged helix-turn-helix transcriptional regulator n=1 Tax=Streptomyces sp. NPDC101160 TaxID=3366118 RepID=UPI00380292A5
MSDAMPDVRKHRPLGYWLRHIDGALEDTMARLFAADGLTRRGWQVLNTLSYEPIALPDVDATMAAFLTADEPTMRPYVDELVARGWAHRTDDELIALTAEGREGHRRVAEKTRAFRAQVVECLAPEEHTALMELLQRVAGHLDTLAAEAAQDTAA